MKKKLLATAIASAMIMPSAFAAQDTSGMHFTSASEGFYASIRVRYNSGGTDNSGAGIENSFSRFGVRGTNDLGGGLEGFYNYEAGVDIDNGSALSTRLAHVGLRGAFGQIWAGSNWAQTYNWVHGTTDVANSGSGNVTGAPLTPGRQNNAIEYTTPDLNGFQGSALVSMDDTGDGARDDTDVDSYILSARYGVAGFDVAASYAVAPESIQLLQTPYGAMVATGVRAALPAANVTDNTATNNDDDFSGYSVKLGYAQDNWYVNAWYHEDNASDARLTGLVDVSGNGSTGGNASDDVTYTGSGVDGETFSIAGGVEVGKVNLYAVYETSERGASGSYTVGNTTTRVNRVFEDEFAVFGVQYNLGVNSRVWIDYVSRDQETAPNNDDFVTIGMQHSF